MKRFIFLTFGFLGWAWYEMSGGADFEPGRISVAGRIDTAPLEANARVARADTSSVALTSVVPVLTAAESQAEPAVAVVATQAVEVAPTVPAVEPEKQEIVAAVEPEVSDSTEAVVVAEVLEPGATVLVTRRDLAAPVRRDIREVTGTRVNMRAGPGTNYQVVTRLRRGDQVAVIDDNGDGWVKIRALDTEELGWMADFLLTASN